MPALFCDTVPRNVRKKTLIHFLPWMVFLHSLCSLLAAINFTNFVLYFYRLVWMKEMTGHNMAYLKIWIENIFSYWLFLPGTWTYSTYYVVSSTVLIYSRLFSNSVFCRFPLQISPTFSLMVTLLDNQQGSHSAQHENNSVTRTESLINIFSTACTKLT